MKNITKNQYEQWNINAKQVRAKNLEWTPDVDEEFLNHVLPILASIPLLRNESNKIDADKILTMLNTDNIIETPNGKMTGRNIRFLIGFLYQQPRGSLIKGAQIKSSTLASLTPLVLYANKLYNDVKYSEWERSAPSMNIMLGYTLQPILEVTSPLALTQDEVLELREQALTFKTGAKKGTMSSLITYKMNINKINEVEYSKIPLFMYLQIWLANAEVRNIDSMILDPFDWDNVPEALDAALSSVLVAKSTFSDYSDLI